MAQMSQPQTTGSVAWISLLRTARAPLAIIVLAGIGVSLPPQSRDMLAALSDGGLVRGEALVFYLSLAFLTFSGWYWARALISARFDVPYDERGREELARADGRLDAFAFDAVPWLIFWLAGVVGVSLIVRSGEWNALWFLLAWAVVYGIFRPTRTTNHRRRPRRIVLRGQAPYRAFGDGPQRSTSSWREWWGNKWTYMRMLTNRAPGGPLAAWAFIGVSAALFAWGGVTSFVSFEQPAVSLPLLLAGLFTGPSAALILFALMIPLLSAITFIADGLRIEFTIHGRSTGPSRPPVIGLLVLVTVLTPYLFHFHTVRVIQADLPKRESLTTYFQDWAKHCAAQDGPIRPIIVAVSGGASRAAVWAAQVLQEVEQASQPGGAAVFAVSSVSGGSLGAAAYMALLSAMNDEERCAASREARWRQTALLEKAPLGDDVLSPLLAGWLASDIPRSMLGPFAAVARVFAGEQPRGGDRAEAIERAFELLWDQPWTTQPRTRFDRPFLSLFYAGERLRTGMPLWIANGTEVASGSRLLTVPVDKTDWPFRASRDALALLNGDVPISTAINNTARFPYLEPSGELLGRKTMKDGSWSLIGRICDQLRVLCGSGAAEVIDGGYFENEGLQTALELAEWLRTAGKRALGGREVWPIIVQATADGGAGLVLGDVVRWDSPPDDPMAARRAQHALQPVTPIVGLYSVRSGHSAVLLREGRDKLLADFVHFMLPGFDGRDVPLNWVLSRETVSRIRGAIRAPHDLKNREEWQRMSHLLNAN